MKVELFRERGNGQLFVTFSLSAKRLEIYQLEDTVRPQCAFKLVSLVLRMCFADEKSMISIRMIYFEYYYNKSFNLARPSLLPLPAGVDFTKRRLLL